MAGQNPFARKVIEEGMFVKHCTVEVYLLELKLACNNDKYNILMHSFSRSHNMEYIKQEMKRMFNIRREKPVRLWNKYMSSTYEEIRYMDKTVSDTGLYQHQLVVIEEQNDDGTWPGPRNSTVFQVPSSKASSQVSSQVHASTNASPLTSSYSSSKMSSKGSSQGSCQASSQVSSQGSSQMSSKCMDSLSCGVCFEKYNSTKHLPKLLPCQHTFCQNCITQIKDKNRNPSTMVCPTCRFKHKVPSEGFTTNRAILDIMDELQSDMAKQSQTSIKCDKHPSKEAVMVCIQCLHGLCLTCVKTSSSSHKDHQLEELDDAVPLLQKRVNDNMEAKRRVLQEKIEQHQKSPASSSMIEKAETTIKSIRDKVWSEVNSWATNEMSVLLQMEEVALTHEMEMQSELESLNPHGGNLTTLMQELRQSEGTDTPSTGYSQNFEVSGYTQDKYEEGAQALLAITESVLTRKYFD